MKSLRSMVLMLLTISGVAWASEPVPSLYDLEARLVDQDGRPTTLDLGRGQPVLISMFYATCPHACPMLIRKIKKIEAQLPPEAQGKVQVVMVSFNGERDSNEKLWKLKDAHGVDPARWHFTRTEASSVEELAAVLGIKYRFLPDGAINHTTVITLLGPDGELLARVDGTDQPVDDLVEKLRTLTAAR
ncbi:MAG: SCO family protein [Myxococcaceae bacterium]